MRKGVRTVKVAKLFSQKMNKKCDNKFFIRKNKLRALWCQVVFA